MARKQTHSEATARATERLLASGGARLTLALTADEAAEWRKLLERYPGHGGQKRAFRAAVNAALAGKALDLPAELERLARELRQKGKAR